MTAILKSEVAMAISRLRKADARAKNAVTQGMRDAAQTLLVESLKLVPIDTGELSKSATIKTNENGFNTTVDVSYGGENAYYAVFVHEDLTKVHGTAFNIKYAHEIMMGREHARRPEEQAKFLEKPAADLTAVKRVFNKSVERRMAGP